ncbi:MAG: phospho-sugar mutase [Acutalibacteraceae bacterium]
MNDTKELYRLWKEKAVLDSDLQKELLAVENDEDEIFDRFYKNLEFGTAGLRGVIGAGTNRMNVYTVNQATQGLADYLNSEFQNPSVAIAYDSRIKSDVFAKSAAGVLAANGIKVYFYPRLVPTPMLSFAVRRLGCSSGIIITASHNPSKYNGYKCYDPNGYQMTDEAADKTYNFIEKVDMFDGVKTMDFEDALAQDMIDFIEDWLFEEFYEKVLSASVYDCKGSDIKIIYTPLNGTGNIPVREILRRKGIENVKVVKEQELPDGNFPTCPFPNPEIKQAFEKAIEMTKEYEADLLLATDPDCDRVGIAVKDGGEYKLLSGNEVGVLLADYLLSVRKEQGTLPENPIVVKSFVTTSLVNAVASSYGAETKELLTGFKYIGELITQLEEKGEENRFIVGMEESYGYLSGIHARDKDAVVASMLIAEMACFYKNKGLSLYERIQQIYDEYGVYLNTLDNFVFEGASGMEKMKSIMEELRNNPPKTIAGLEVTETADYLRSQRKNTQTGEESVIDLPKSNVLAYKLPGGSGAIVRPSGTEPKIKVYVTACADTKENADALSKKISGDMKKNMKIN